MLTPKPNGGGEGVGLCEGSMRITPADAETILSNYSYPRQRAISAPHVNLLGRIMKRGDWLENDQLSFCETPDGKWLLVNGYHRLTAVIKFRTSHVFQLRVIPAHTPAEVDRVYSTFDTVNRKRSDGDILHASGVPATYHLKKHVAAAVYRAATLLGNRFYGAEYQSSQPHLDPRDVLARIHAAQDYWEYGRVLQTHLERASYAYQLRLLMPPIAAVAIITIKHCPELASTFWSGVASVEGLPAGDPRLTFANHVRDNRYTRGGSRGGGGIPQPARDCAVAWNAWFEGRKISMIRKAAFRIAGTTWKER